MLSPLKTIFWLVLHTASALAATIILNLPTTDTLTEDTTLILKHLQTAAALYCQDKAAEAIRTYGYQPTSLWEAAVQDAIDTATQLIQPPHLILLTIALAVIAAVIRYHFMLHQLKKQQRPQRQNRLLTAARMLTLQRLLAKLANILTSTSTNDTRRTSGGTPTGSIPSTTTELLNRARRAGFGVSLAGSGHHKIWASGTPRQGRSVTIPATASDHRSLLNSVMTIRSVLGVDLRKY